MELLQCGVSHYERKYESKQGYVGVYVEDSISLCASNIEFILTSVDTKVVEYSEVRFEVPNNYKKIEQAYQARSCL